MQTAYSEMSNPSKQYIICDEANLNGFYISQARWSGEEPLTYTRSRTEIVAQ